MPPCPGPAKILPGARLKQPMIPKVPTFFPPVLSPGCQGSVFYQEQPSPGGDFGNRFHVGRASKKMHRKDYLRTFCNGVLQTGGIHIEGTRIGIHQGDFSARVGDGGGGGGCRCWGRSELRRPVSGCRPVRPASRLLFRRLHPPHDAIHSRPQTRFRRLLAPVPAYKYRVSVPAVCPRRSRYAEMRTRQRDLPSAP